RRAHRRRARDRRDRDRTDRDGGLRVAPRQAHRRRGEGAPARARGCYTPRKLNRRDTLPRWARAADFLSLLLVVVALPVAASGGFRTRIGDSHFALTSPYRVLVWAIGIAVARHLMTRQQPVYRHLPGQMAAWARSAPFRAAAATVVGTRPAIYFVGYLA